MIPVNEQNAADAAAEAKARTQPAKNLAEAMARVMERVSYVQKDKKMAGGASYRYVSVEAVIEALRPEMLRERLVLLPTGVRPLTLEAYDSKSGSRQNRTQVIYTFKLVHAPSCESEPIEVIGEGIDSGDKSGNKAMTAARKYAHLMAFNMETGDDPDNTPSHEQQRAPAQQVRPATQTAASPDADLVNRFDKRLETCTSREQFDAITLGIKQALDAKHISPEGANYLRESCNKCLSRIDGPKAAQQQPAGVRR